MKESILKSIFSPPQDPANETISRLLLRRVEDKAQSQHGGVNPMSDGRGKNQHRHFLPIAHNPDEGIVALELNPDGEGRVVQLEQLTEPTNDSFTLTQCPGTGFLHEVERSSDGRRSSVGPSGLCDKYRKGWQRTFGDA